MRPEEVRLCTNCRHEIGDDVDREYDTCDGCFLDIEQMKSGIVDLSAPLFDSPWPRLLLFPLAGGIRWNWDAEFRIPAFLCLPRRAETVRSPGPRWARWYLGEGSR